MKALGYIFFCFFYHLASLCAQDSFALRTVNVDQGLSQNSVVSIAEDQNGFLWFATQDGLNQFDGIDFNIKSYNFEDKTRKDYFRLGKVFVDSSSRLWLTPLNGALLMESMEGVTQFPSIVAPSAMVEVSNKLWVGTYGNGLFFIEKGIATKTSLFQKAENIYHLVRLDEKSLLVATDKGLYQYFFQEDKLVTISKEINVSSIYKGQKACFVSTFNGKLFRFENDKLQPLQLTDPSWPNLPIDTVIYDILEDDNGRLWVGTFKQGVFVLDFKNHKVTHLKSNKYNQQSLSYDYVLDLYKDSNGIIWIGTDGGGVSYYDQYLNKFNVLTNKDLKEGLYVDLVISLSVDETENAIWMGTSGNGLTKYHPQTGEGKSFMLPENNRVLSLLHDDEGTFWVGLFQDGVYTLQGEKLSKMSNPSSNLSIANLSVAWMLDVGANEILFGTFDHGIFLYHMDEGVKQVWNTENTSNLSSDFTTCAYRMGPQEVLIGLNDGNVFQLNLASRKLNSFVDAAQIDRSKIKSLLYKDASVLVGTTNGLYILKEGVARHIDRSKGLPNNVIYAIAPDEENNLWVSTNHGIAKLSQWQKDEELRIKNFNKFDGLQGNEFNTGAYYQSKDGTIYFGGIHGINWFHPTKLIMNKNIPSTQITQFLLTKENRNAPLKLRYNQNDVSIQFSSSSIALAHKNQYRYRLLGIDDEWKSLGNRNYIDFIGLPWGSYEFQVVGSNYDGVWSKIPATLAFTINPPWYRTAIAYAVYALLFLGFSIYIFKLLLNTKLAKQQVVSAAQLDEAKSTLYANISHEFKTPLTLIKGLSGRLLKKESLSSKAQQSMASIHENGEQLLLLVNQMLELVSLDHNQLSENYKSGDIVGFVKKCVFLFAPYADSRKQKLSFASEVKSLVMDIDDSKLQKVLNNILSNAVKFTPKNGKIAVRLQKKSPKKLRIEIEDTGKGIAAEDLPHIFDRYYKTFDLDNNIGSGIGMELTKGLVTFMKGSISIESDVGKGTTFTIELPIENSKGKKEALCFQNPFVQSNTSKATLQQQESVEEKPTILIVEDHVEIRNYFRELFQDRYQILEASNGKKALEISENRAIDFIISDVVMPVMDGFQFCEQIKHNAKTSHVPFIMVSAKTDTESRLQGYKLGVDAYIQKPFNENELVQIIENLFVKREEQMAFYQQILDLKSIPSNVKNTNQLDIDFIHKIQQFALRATQDQTMEELAKDLWMSRTQLHRKIKQLTNMSITQYINHIKLEKAKHLLLNTPLSIAEIAYEVGFEDPKYFSKLFKKEQGKTPSVFREKP